MEIKTAEADSQLSSEVNVADEPNHLGTEQTHQGKIQSTTHVGTYEPKSVQSSITRSVNSSAISLNRITQATGFCIPTERTIDGFPVEEALASYIGVDISAEGAESEKRRGVTIIIHGPAMSGRTTQASALADFYSGVVLDMDTIIMEAISSACTEAGIKSRMLCLQSMAAKAADTTEITASLASKKQVSCIKDKELHQTEVLLNCRRPSLFEVNPHMDTSFAVPDGYLMPTILQEENILKIFSKRFAQPDCLEAIIIDGIESSFSGHCLQLLLRAFNNRAHIYFVNLEVEPIILRKRQEEIDHKKLLKVREEERRIREAELAEEDRINTLLEMDEDEYELLTDEQMEEIDAFRLMRKKSQRMIKKKEMEEILRLEREKEEEEKLREGERFKKRAKRERKSVYTKVPIVMDGEGSTKSRRCSLVSTLGSAYVPPSPVPAESSGVSLKSDPESPSNITATLAATPRYIKPRKRKDSKQTEPDNLCPLETSYNHYMLELEGVKSILEGWDRERGSVRTKKSTESDDPKSVLSKKCKSSKVKDLETATLQEVTSENEEDPEGLGVPLIDMCIDESLSESDIHEKILASGLPSHEEILNGLGLGPAGIPIPDPVTLQVCPFPLKREPAKQESDIFCFLAISEDDP